MITNEDIIRSLDHDCLVDFLENICFCFVEDNPWYKQFDEVFCRGKCNLSNCTAPECPYGEPIDWWLKQPVEVNNE